ncbi:MAG: zinc-ribbon domain-containing protein [Polyangiaceae bacterium]
MKITCHSCAAKYTVSDEKVQGKTVKMKCRKCGATIVVGGSAQGGEPAQFTDDATVAQAAPQDPAAQDAPPPGSYLVNVADGDQRTMTLGEVVEAYNGGVITGDTYVWADGMNDWQSLSENDSIVAALNEAAKANASLVGGNGAAAFGASASPSNAPLAASPSSNPAARKDGGRKSPDLFGSGGGGFGDSSGAALASSSSVSGTGKRDENSVLFSLNALTGTAPAGGSSRAGSATKEDSGLIDLKALAASAAPAASVSDASPLDGPGLFPIAAPVLAPPPVATAPTAVSAPPAKSSKLPLIFGAIAVVAVGVAIFVVVKSGDSGNATAKTEDTKPPPTSLVPTNTPIQTNAVAATATDSPPAGTSAAPTDTSSAKAGSTNTGKGKPTTTTTTTGKATATTTTTGTATATTKPKGKDCGCGTDLNCQLKCVAGKK